MFTWLLPVTEKGLLVSSLSQVFSMYPLRLLASSFIGLSSFSVLHRIWSLSLWSQLQYPCEFSPAHCFSQVRWQKLAVTLSMAKRERRTVPLSLLFYFAIKVHFVELVYDQGVWTSPPCLVQVNPDSYQINLILCLYVCVGLFLLDQFTAG